MAGCLWFGALYFRVVFYLWLVYSSAGSCDQDALGLQSGYILDSEMTSSSVRDLHTPAKNGRLNYTAGRSWCADPSNKSPYLQIDLETIHIICAVSTQGNSKQDEWVETYRLKSSTDGTSWADYQEDGQVKTFLGNFDRSTVVKHVLYMGMVARFLRFLPQSNHSSICLRAEVYGVPQNQGNLALYKPTSMSTTNLPYVSSNAVDGNRATHVSKCAITSGWGSTDPWWRADLGQVEPVSELYIVNRGDCCGDRLNGFQIEVGNVTTGGGVSNHLCGRGLNVPQGKGRPFQCKPTAFGRYVYIRLPGSNKILTLCEVEVYSTSRPNLALNQPASQSSTYPYSGGTANKAVDGNASTHWSQGSCTVTNTETDPWWRVDLGSSLPVAEVFIVNRACGGSCGDRLKGFEIRIGSDDTNGGISNPQCGVGLFNLNSGEKKSFFCEPRLVGRYVFIRIPGGGKTLTICELEVYTTRTNYQACAGQAVGISDVSLIPNYRFISSSSRSGNEPFKGRLRGSSVWVPSTNNDANDFLQIDLGSVYFVCGVATQGNPSADEWTRTYNITTSLNNKKWEVYAEDNKAKEFVGNDDRNSIVKSDLKQPLAAKFIRFYPVSYNGSKALRVEVFGSLESCQSSLGMENKSITVSQIKSSPVTDASHGSSFGRLYSSSSSWCSSTSSLSAYLQVDLGHVKTVTGVATQGDPSSDKWVTEYDIAYGYNGKTWIRDVSNQQLTGNTDRNTVFVNWFSVPFAAQYVRIIPQAQHTSVCLRMDLYGCGHFQVPYLYVKELSDVTLPTTPSGGSVSLSCQAEFSQQRPATFTWSNNGKVLSESTSSITVKYKGAVDTRSNYHCLMINPSSREVYCNTTYSVKASLPGINLQSTVDANVTAVLKVPDKPVVSIGIIAARSTTVTWKQPSQGSDEASISSFKLEYSNNSFTSAPLSLSSGTTNKQLINLKPYTSYSVKVMTTSVVGEGSWSTTKTFTTSTAAPEVAPLVTNLTAITSQSIYIQWKKPDVEKINGPLKQYKIIYQKTGASSALKLENITAPTTSHTLRNLKKWTNYKVEVRVNNGDHDGPSSSERTIRTMQDAPSAPEDLVLSVKGPTESMGPQLVITWKKPAEENGIILGYILKYTFVLGAKSTSRQKNLSDSTFKFNINVFGGVKYTIDVLAETIKPGPKKSKTMQVETYRPSITPQGISSQKINDTTYNITWQPLPREKSNGKVVAYEVKSSDVTKSRKRRTSSTPEAVYKNSTDASVMLYDLKSCAKYKVEVRAYTTAGPGDFGDIDRVIETTAPEAPTNVQTNSVAKTSVTLKWNEPVIHGGKVAKYTITYEGRKDYYPGFKDTKSVDASETKKTISELYPGTKYNFTVSATSHCGVGDNSTMVSIETLVSAPKAPEDNGTSEITTSETSANVTVWMSRQDNGPISDYQVIIYRVNKWADEISDGSKDLPDYDTFVKKKLDVYITAQFPSSSVNPSRVLVVGDGKKYGNFTNAKLSRGQKYKIYSRAKTSIPKTLFSAERLIAQIEVEDIAVATTPDSSTGGGSSGVIAGVAVAVVLIILAAVFAGVFVWRRRRSPEEPAKADQPRAFPMVNVSTGNLLVSCDGSDGGGDASAEVPAQGVHDSGPIYSNTEPVHRDDQPRPVPANQFAEYVTRLRRGHDPEIRKQYKRLHNGQQFSWEVAKKPENKVKNRYGNIIAYDHSRVVLPFIEGEEHSDYINANYLPGFDKTPKAYIACQGPVTGTFGDFWRMVWIEKTGIIVMLTRLVENSRVKCHQYWPEEKETYGDVTVVNHKTETFADYVIRTFFLSKSGSEERRQVHQFHFLAWPDKGVPQYATAVLGLRRKVRAIHRNSKNPLLVHCSAGIGRTGAFVVIDGMIESAKRKKVVDVFNYVQAIRDDRISMVQTDEQYVFIYNAILEDVTCGNTEIATQDLRIVIKKLSAVHPEKRISGFASEFRRLELITTGDVEREDDVGRRPENAVKNRFSKIVPLNESRVVLMVEEKKDYINASFVDAYREHNAFIMTQAPMDNTKADFWQMVWDYNIGTIVMLNELKEQGQVYPVYWPSQGSATLENFTVEAVSHEIFQDFTEREFTLAKGNTKTVRHVLHYQVTGWPEKGVPGNPQCVLELVNVVERSQRKCNNAPVVVHCSNGVGRSGTFCAILSILERLKSEQVLDIFQAIKVLRVKRPKAVDGVAQYEFCYNVVQNYLDSFDTYANFT